MDHQNAEEKPTQGMGNPNPHETPEFLVLIAADDQELFHAGLASLRQSNSADALDVWRELSDRYPQNPLVQHNLGLAYAGASEYWQAHKHFSNAHKIDPNYPDSLINACAAGISASLQDVQGHEMYELLDELRNAGKIEDMLEQIGTKFPMHNVSSAGFIVRGIVFFETGRYQEALELLDAAIFMRPDIPNPYMIRSSVHWKLNQLRKSYYDSEQALFYQLKQDPNSVSTATLLLTAGKGLHGGCENWDENGNLIVDQETSRILYRVIDICTGVLESEPFNIKALDLRIRSNMGLAGSEGDWSHTLPDLKLLVQLDPNDEQSASILETLLETLEQRTNEVAQEDIASSAEEHIPLTSETKENEGIRGRMSRFFKGNR